MTTLSHQPSLRPALASLPPTLQPHAVLSLAPPVDRARSFAVSAGVYALLAGGLIWAAHTGVQAIQTLPPAIGPVVIGVPSPPTPVPVQPHPATPSKAPVMPQQVVPKDLIPDVAPPLDTTDHSGEPPLQSVQASGPGPNATTATNAGPISLSGDSVRILHSVTPTYPPLAKMARRQGQVVIRMTIDTGGIPTDVQAVSGEDVFTLPALQAARQWRFAPATQNGVAVPATFLLTLNFVLK